MKKFLLILTLKRVRDMKKIIMAFLSLLLLLLISCSKDRSELHYERLENKYCGDYRLAEIVFSSPVDLDGDGVCSENLRDELTGTLGFAPESATLTIKVANAQSSNHFLLSAMLPVFQFVRMSSGEVSMENEMSGFTVFGTPSNAYIFFPDVTDRRIVDGGTCVFRILPSFDYATGVIVVEASGSLYDYGKADFVAGTVSYFFRRF